MPKLCLLTGDMVKNQGQGGGARVSRVDNSDEDEQYSEAEDGADIVDIGAVSRLGESAPTSLSRSRTARDEKQIKLKESVKREAAKAKREGGRRAAGSSGLASGTAAAGGAMKDEPTSPAQPMQMIVVDSEEEDGEDAGAVAVRRKSKGKQRADDTMLSDDEQVDRDEHGVRLDHAEEDVNLAQAVDLDESDDEEYEEGMEGDFVQEDETASRINCGRLF